MDANKLKNIINKSRMINEKLEGQEVAAPQIDRNFFENENSTFAMPAISKKQRQVINENVVEEKSTGSPFLDRVKESFKKLPPQTGEHFNPYNQNIDLSELMETVKPAKKIIKESTKSNTQNFNDFSSIMNELKKEIKNIVREELEDIIDEKIKQANKETLMNEQIQLRVGDTLFLGNITKQKSLKSK